MAKRPSSSRPATLVVAVLTTSRLVASDARLRRGAMVLMAQARLADLGGRVPPRARAAAEAETPADVSTLPVLA